VGLFDEIRKALEEAAEEARRQGQPVAGRPTQIDEDLAETRRQRAFARQNAQAATEADAQAEAVAAAEQARRVLTAANQAKNNAATIRRAAPAVQRATSPDRIRQLLRQPGSVREIIVLSEVLARPLALKRK